MEVQMRLKGVIFDLDGTLLDRDQLNSHRNAI
jgi:hydroxymethylpyrimidine pyrophosphatase-like HAD family hydrolase